MAVDSGDEEGAISFAVSGDQEGARILSPSSVS